MFNLDRFIPILRRGSVNVRWQVEVSEPDQGNFNYLPTSLAILVACKLPNAFVITVLLLPAWQATLHDAGSISRPALFEVKYPFISQYCFLHLAFGFVILIIQNPYYLIIKLHIRLIFKFK